MARPINIIKFRHDPKATLGRNWHIVIDKADLVDLLEQSVTEPIPGHWPSKQKALLNMEELRRSLSEKGEHELLICANCAASGYKSCGDLDLKPFRVTQELDYILWEVLAPDPKHSEDSIKTLEFKFHRPQYESELTRLFQNKGRST